METENLMDIYRIKNPDKNLITWTRGKIRRRLDYFLISDHISNNNIKISTSPCTLSDHYWINFSIISHKNRKGRGFWKLNTSLLEEEEYIKLIRNSIIDTIQENKNHNNDQLIWELIKLEVRNVTIPYCIKRKKEKTKTKNNLIERINKIHTNQLDGKETEEENEEYYLIKNELAQIEIEESRGIIIRAKCDWVELGEKNSKFFLQLEKHNQENKVISSLKTDKGIITHSKKY